jgi:probable phosphoglycerate mutase
VIARIRDARAGGDVLVFAHGHLLRVLTARWIGLGPASGGLFELATATVSILGSERESPSIELWNEACHLGT